MRFGTAALGAAIGAVAGLARGGKGETIKYALYGAGAGFVAQLLGVSASSSIVVGAAKRPSRCQCWANVDVFGNIQDHQTCYPTHTDAAQKTNGFPGTPSDAQGGDRSTWVACPQA